MKYVVEISPENKGFSRFRLCKKCNEVKPPRTHHCSICQTCVMRMDHHCPWTGNCIGLKNYKYFICFLFWTIMACLHVAISSPLLNKHIKLFSHTKQDLIYASQFFPLNPLLAHILSITVSIGVFILFGFNLRFLHNNEIPIESAELLLNGNPFNMKNRTDNYKQVLGQDKWLWPLSAPENIVDGLSYPVRK